MKLFKWLKQKFCEHVVSASEIKRTPPEGVEATCLKCGKVLKAPYGLALDARLAK
jgi:hypothetical protein